jgi:hypothetical protein
VGGNGGGVSATAVTAESGERITSSIVCPVREAEAEAEEKKDARVMLVATMRHFGLRAVAPDASDVAPGTLKDIQTILLVVSQTLNLYPEVGLLYQIGRVSPEVRLAELTGEDPQ